MQRSPFAWLFINLFILSSCSQPQVFVDKQSLDSLFHILSERDFAFGAAAVSRNGELAYQKVVGYARINEDGKTLSSTETKYRIGSVTKTFTAVIIFQLIEEGKLRLDSRLAHYFPGIPNAQEISVSDMLYHRSGLANYTDDQLYKPWKYKKISRSELLELLSQLKPNFNPNQRAEYSNTNFLLLSLIIEKICNKMYQEVLSQRILSKLSLEDTYFEKAADSALKGSKSYKYADFGWIQQPEDVAENHMGAGALVSTPDDLLKFIDALFTHKLINKQSLEKMTSLRQGYGMGIFPFEFETGRAYGHEGRINEFYTTLIHFPRQNLSLAYCTNAIVYPRDDIVKTVVEICTVGSYKLPYSHPENTEQCNLDKLVGSYESESMPIAVSCKMGENGLIFTTQGEDFETSMINENYFVNYQYGYFFEFLPRKNQLMIKETDNIYRLNKVQ